MKHWIVILLILAAASLELKWFRKEQLEGFFSSNDFEFPDTFPTIDIDTIPEQEPAKFTGLQAWVFVPKEINARHWQNFGSRRATQPVPALLQFCHQSIKKHVGSQFNVRLFSESDITQLLPEYVNQTYWNQIQQSYMFHTLLQYAILYKYGGLWIPFDTLVLRDLPAVPTQKVVSFSANNLLYRPNGGIDESILFAPDKHPMIQSGLEYILAHLSGFQNAYSFKQALNTHMNVVLSSSADHEFKEWAATKDSNGHWLSEEFLVSHNQVLLASAQICMVPLHWNNLLELPKYNFLARMSDDQLLKSSFQLTRWIRQSFGMSKGPRVSSSESNLYAFGKSFTVIKE